MKQLVNNTIAVIEQNEIATSEVINRALRARLTILDFIDWLDANATLKFDFATNSYHIRENTFGSVNKQFADVVPFTRNATKSYTPMFGANKTATANEPTIEWQQVPLRPLGIEITDDDVNTPDRIEFENIATLPWFESDFGTFFIKVKADDVFLLDGIGVNFVVEGDGVLIVTYDDSGIELRTFNNTETTATQFQPSVNTILALGTLGAHIESFYYVPTVFSEHIRTLMAFGDLSVSIIDADDAVETADLLYFTVNTVIPNDVL